MLGVTSFRKYRILVIHKSYGYGMIQNIHIGFILNKLDIYLKPSYLNFLQYK